MKSIPPVFYKNSIRSLLYAHIEDGVKYYDDLTDSDKEIISAECFKELGSDAYDIILQESNLDGFANYLSSGDMDSGYSVLSNMKQSVISYFDQFMKPLFDEMLEEYEYQVSEEKREVYKQRDHSYVERLHYSAR